MQPIRLTHAVAYVQPDRREVLICTVVDGAPGHALTLTAEDLAALMQPFGEPTQADVPRDVREAIIECLVQLTQYQQGNPFVGEPETPEMKIVTDWLDTLPLPQDGES